MPAKNDFEALDIPVGANLTYKDQDDVTCLVVEQKPAKVYYGGQVTSVTEAAKKAGGYPGTYSLNGNRYWKYEGELLADRKKRYSEAPDEEQTTLKDEASMDFDPEEMQREIDRLTDRVSKLEKRADQGVVALVHVYAEVVKAFKGVGKEFEDISDKFDSEFRELAEDVDINLRSFEGRS